MAPSNAVQQYCTFHVADLYLGIRVERVQEVIRALPVTAVPLAPPAVRGLINLRGQIVEAIDLRECLGFEPLPAGRAPMNVIIRDEGGGLSLLVDRIGDVLDVEEQGFESPPDTLPPGVRDLLGGVYKLADRLLLELNVDRAVAVTAAAS